MADSPNTKKTKTHEEPKDEEPVVKDGSASEDNEEDWYTEEEEVVEYISSEEEEEVEEKQVKKYDSYEEEEGRPWYRRKQRTFLKVVLLDGFPLPELTGSLSRLPEEIVMNILARVPLSHLYRSRLVSKFWYVLLRHPRFAKFHLNKLLHNDTTHKISQSIFFVDKRNVCYYIAADHEEFSNDKYSGNRLYMARVPPYDLVHLDSCNGLVFMHQPPFLILNPITGQLIQLPKPPMWRMKCSVFAFGFDRVNDEYKVIRVLEKKGHSDVEILSLGLGKWRLIPNVPYTFKAQQSKFTYAFNGENSSMFVNEAFHWIGSKKGKHSRDDIIITFKIDTEELGEVLMPTGLGKLKGKFDHYLVVLGECLGFVHTVGRKHIEIWIMKEYGVQKSWMKEYVIKDLVIDTSDFFLEDLLDPDIDDAFLNKGSRRPYVPIQMLNNGEIQLLCSERYLCYYDPNTEGLRCTEIFGTEHMMFTLHPVLHMGTLISPWSICPTTNSNGEEENSYDKDCRANDDNDYGNGDDGSDSGVNDDDDEEEDGDGDGSDDDDDGSDDDDDDSDSDEGHASNEDSDDDY